MFITMIWRKANSGAQIRLRWLPSSVSMAEPGCGWPSAPRKSSATHQLVKPVCPAWHLVDDPGLKYLAKFLEVGVIEHIEEAGIGQPTLEVQA
jgi:hypothetical protein